MDPRQWPAEKQAIVASSLLLSSGIELLAAACGVDVSGRVTDGASSTPWPILFSFGMVLAAVGVGVITRVMHMSWFGLVFNVYATAFLRIIGAAEATWFQLVGLAISAPCCLLLGLRSSAAPTVHIGLSAGELASTDKSQPHSVEQEKCLDPKSMPKDKLEEVEDDAREWSVESSMCVTMAMCASSLFVNVLFWAGVIPRLVATNSPLRIPLGIAVLPLSSWWIRLFSGGAPFVTTNHAKTRAIVRLAVGGAVAGNGAKQANGQPHRLVGADLGSGDGRLAIALARAGVAEVHGYEINWLLVQYSRARVAEAGLAGRVTIHWQSMWDVNLSHCDIITCYQHTMVMSKLEVKLVKELKPTARVVSNSFRFPTWEPTFISTASVRSEAARDDYIDGGGEEGGAILLYTNPQGSCSLPKIEHAGVFGKKEK